MRIAIIFFYGTKRSFFSANFQLHSICSYAFYYYDQVCVFLNSKNTDEDVKKEMNEKYCFFVEKTLSENYFRKCFPEIYDFTM